MPKKHSSGQTRKPTSLGVDYRSIKGFILDANSVSRSDIKTQNSLLLYQKSHFTRSILTSRERPNLAAKPKKSTGPMFSKNRGFPNKKKWYIHFFVEKRCPLSFCKILLKNEKLVESSLARSILSEEVFRLLQLWRILMSKVKRQSVLKAEFTCVFITVKV